MKKVPFEMDFTYGVVSAYLCLIQREDGTNGERGRSKQGLRPYLSGREAAPNALAANGDDIGSGRCQ